MKAVLFDDRAAAMSAAMPIPWWRPQHATLPTVSMTDGSRVAFRALVAFTVILLLSPQIYFPILGTMRIAFLAAGLAIAAHVIDRTMRQRPITPTYTEIGVALSLVVWSVVTIPLSYWPGGSVEVLTDHYLKAIAFFWLLGTVTTSSAHARALAWTLVLCSIPLAATGMHNYVVGMFLSTGVPGLKRIYGYDGGSGLVGNPNDLALMLNLIIPITAAVAAGARRRRTKWIAWSTVALSAVTVILTFSRAGFLTLLTTFVMFLVILARRKSPTAAAALMVAALAVPPILPAGYLDRLSTITNIATDRTGSAQGRWDDLRLAGEVILTNPVIGVGIGQDVLALRDERGTGWTSVHNAYLQYAVDLGIPGFLLFIWLHISCFRSARAVEKRAAGNPALHDLAQLGQGVQIALLSFAVAAFFHPIAYQFYFFTIGGLAIALKNACRNEIAQAQLVARRTL